MTPQSRYSLVALLLLIAAVAWWINSWRVPQPAISHQPQLPVTRKNSERNGSQRVVLLHPLSAAGQKILTNHPVLEGYLNASWRTLEYETSAELQNSQVRLLIARYDQEIGYAFIHDDANKPVRRVELHAPSNLLLESKATPQEHIVALLDFNQLPEVSKRQEQSVQVILAGLKKYYLVSSHRRIYQVAGFAHVALPVREVPLPSISDEWQRQQLAAELARIPAALSKPYIIPPRVAAIETAAEISHEVGWEQRFEERLRQNRAKPEAATE